MSCFFPLTGWRSRSVNDSGRRSLVFNPRAAEFPHEPLQVPCGSCLGCRSDQSRAWAVRMYHESTLHERSSFLTLTYDEDHCPTAINKRDLQLFWKRLRLRVGPLRYFACGEYGSVTRRPHYHAVVFGHDFLGGAVRMDEQLYMNPAVTEVWKNGSVTIADFSISSALYVAGYCVKKLGDKDTFCLMSRKPPIGSGWLQRYHDDLRRTGSVVIDGQLFNIPPVYLEWSQEELQSVIDERSNYFRTMSVEQKYARSVSLRGRHANLQARLSAKRRDSL